ncbi:Endoribonuclease L-PSP/chorismate mutase-like protein [Microdochium bolleyi]|uniref:Endoribonuclease L-PSP/chorismate mutase-like protein n=1 Tax=Microdochium bolleyi TaxID=196109 RepID=A0A136IK51_9PEZI|nr:Endoribonuclease L-PSP/chorismate mutase-like protein [Microdochium bolleyi]
MTKPEFFTYPGTEEVSEQFHVSQVVRKHGDGITLKTGGQVGLDASGNLVADPQQQVEQTLQNVLSALRAADPNITWRNITALRSYHLDINATFEFATAAFKKLDPAHRPVWACVGVSQLGYPGAVVEFEAEAFVDV